MAQKKKSSSKKSPKSRVTVRDLVPRKSDRVTAGKLPGKRTPPTVTLKRGMTRNIP